MRDAKSLLFNHAIPIEDQIEIDGARGTWMWTGPSEVAFDAEKGLEQRAGFEKGASDGGGVEKPGLITDAHGCRVMEG